MEARPVGIARADRLGLSEPLDFLLLVLDFKRVKPAERDAAKALFAEGGMNGHGDEKGPTKEQVAAIKAAIQNATTLEEVNRLEAQLKATGGTDIDASKQGMDLD